MNRRLLMFLIALAAAGCGSRGVLPTDTAKTLPEARRGFRTNLRLNPLSVPVDQPPQEVFRLVRYPSAVGDLSAYVSPDPGDGREHPAIVWITGGDCNTIGDVWSVASPDNDQTAAAYRQEGMIMMFPSLRGGNDNPGSKEGFFGEVDDVIAAGQYLAEQPYVDPKRIYLGGHSTGGTLVLLVAETTDQFRAVFSFGPADQVSGYGSDFLPFDTSNPREIALRSPGNWLHSAKSRTYVFEGTHDGNLLDLLKMSRRSSNPRIQFFPVKGASHFSILAPVNAIIARKIREDTGPSVQLSFTSEELNQPFGN
jgi:acetyl esterase/lipase